MMSDEWMTRRRDSFGSSSFIIPHSSFPSTQSGTSTLNRSDARWASGTSNMPATCCTRNESNTGQVTSISTGGMGEELGFGGQGSGRGRRRWRTDAVGFADFLASRLRPRFVGSACGSASRYSISSLQAYPSAVRRS